MSLKTLPLLFINLGGEMVYILDQRLRAQSISPDKAQKVLYDIVGTMTNPSFVEELFRPQDLYDKKALRSIFERLAHSSIMRLNPASMDKLYDLMTMAVKHQISLCLRPDEILLITLNHLDAMRKFVKDEPKASEQLNMLYTLVNKQYSTLNIGSFMLIRQSLLSFFQDMHVRVSIFLKEKVQLSSGQFVLPLSEAVPAGADIPGSIRLYDLSGRKTKTFQFDSGCQFSYVAKRGSFDLYGDRVTKLGTNMYSSVKPSDTTVSGGGSSEAPSSETEPSTSHDPSAVAQLELLSQLVGNKEKKSTRPDVRLNLFNADEDDDDSSSAMRSRPAQAESQARIVNIDASKNRRSEELSKIMSDMHVDSRRDDDEDDLLDLMDKAR